LSGTQLTVIALAIAGGLSTCHELSFPEPDLAPQDVFVSLPDFVKISHFATTETKINWQSPEVAGGGEYTCQSDIFNFGVVLYKMIASRDRIAGRSRSAVGRMFESPKTFPDLPHRTPPALRDLVRRCWARDPDQRPKSSEIYAQFEAGKVHFDNADLRAVQRFASRFRAADHEKDRLDLAVFENYRGSEFFRGLDIVEQELPEDQYENFLRTVSRALSCSSPDTILAVLIALVPLMRRERFADIFVQLRLIFSLPTDDARFLDTIFEIFYPLFERDPRIFEGECGDCLNSMVENRPEKALILLELFAKGFNEMEDPWTLLDLMLGSHGIYLKSSVGSEYLSLLYFLNASFPRFRKARFLDCRPIFVLFLCSPDENAVQVAYKAICGLFNTFSDLPIEQLTADLSQPELAFPAISVLLRFPRLPARLSLFPPLLSLAETYIEATLILLDLVNTSQEGASGLIATSKWLTRNLPTFEDTLRLFLAVMKWKRIRPAISKMAEFPAFLLAIVQSNDECALICMGSICKRLVLRRVVFRSVKKLRFFPALSEMVHKFVDSQISYLGIDILTMFALIGYCKDYLDFIPVLGKYLRAAEPNVARSAFLSIYVLSRYRQCAIQFKKRRIDRSVRAIVTGESEAKKVNRFLANIQKLG
jgi:hypothetical protein